MTQRDTLAFVRRMAAHHQLIVEAKVALGVHKLNGEPPSPLLTHSVQCALKAARLKKPETH
jgi:hypothetical protein